MADDGQDPPGALPADVPVVEAALPPAVIEDADRLPPPEVLAREIVDNREAALAEFTAVAEALEKAAAERGA